MSSARDDILGRIREALRLPAAKPTLADIGAADGKSWLPDAGDAPESRRRLLGENLAKLRARLVAVPDLSAAAAALASLVRENGWSRLAYHGHSDTRALIAGLPCDTWSVDTDFDKQRLEGCDVGLTTCEALVAQTGSILVSSAGNGGRALSILPPVHVVVARADQLVGDLADAFRLVRERHGAHLPSMLSFITGPSRTGDIERILVLGAHGPKDLIVLLVG